MAEDRFKIKLCQSHFAYIDKKMLQDFHRYAQIVNLQSFIKKSFYTQFNFLITSKEDFPEVDRILQENYYRDKTEWLREIMRRRILEYKRNITI